MSVVLPLRSDLPFFDVKADLDNVTYTLEFRWNVRAAGWFLNVLDEQGQAILAAGLRVVVNFPLLAHIPSNKYRRQLEFQFWGRSPPGALVFVDTGGKGEDPGLTDLGVRVALLYFSVAELGL